MKSVIFIDFGWVYFEIARSPIIEFGKEHGISEKKMFDVMWKGPLWNEHAVGRYSEKTYRNKVSQELGVKPGEVQKLLRTCYNYSTPQNGMSELIRKLRENYTVAALSSIAVPWIRVFEKKYKISKIFHDHHYSYDHGIDKPEARFFLSAAKKMKVKPEDCIVVDDRKDFLDNVKKTGARTILFKNPKQLEKQLRKMGIKI